MKLHKAREAGYYPVAQGAVPATSGRVAGRNRKTAETFGDLPEIPGVHLSGRGVLPAGISVRPFHKHQAAESVAAADAPGGTQLEQAPVR